MNSLRRLAIQALQGVGNCAPKLPRNIISTRAYPIPLLDITLVSSSHHQGIPIHQLELLATTNRASKPGILAK